MGSLRYVLPLFCLCFATVLCAQPGQLNASLDGDGKVVTDFSPRDLFQAVAFQPDGKIVAAGHSIAAVGYSTQQQFAAVRYLADGSVDTSFGSNGIATLAIGNGSGTATSVMILPNGRILLAGSAGGDFAVARLMPDGAVDTSFGLAGKSTIRVNGAEGTPGKALLLQDGRVVLSGTVASADGGDMVLIRFLPNGALDPEFGQGGVATVDFGGAGDSGYAVAAAADGALFVAGASMADPVTWKDFAVAKVLPSGTPDPAFGVNGRVVFDLGNWMDEAKAVAVDPKGRILLAGNSLGDVVAARLLADGSIDATFGQGGIGRAAFSGNEEAFDLCLLPDGKLLVAGSLDTNLAATLQRFTENGWADKDFAGDGLAEVTFSVLPGAQFQLAAFWGVAVQPDGKHALAAGYSMDGPLLDFALARFELENIDLTPDALVSATISGAVPGSVQESDLFVVSGLGTGVSVPLRVSAGEYSLNGEAWTAAPGWATNGDTIRIRHACSGLMGATTTTLLHLGGVRPANNQTLILGDFVEIAFTSETAAAPADLPGDSPTAAGGGGSAGCTAGSRTLPVGLLLLLGLPAWMLRRRRMRAPANR